MEKLRLLRPIRHAVLWIGIYLVVVTVGDALSEMIGTANIVTAPLILALSVALLFYLRSATARREYGLVAPTGAAVRSAWFYVPLAALVLFPIALSTGRSLGTGAAVLVVVLMLGVAFVEELVFRGFLFQAIRSKSSLRRAVLITSVTFGLGHAVNLLRGLGGAEQLLQVLMAVAVGIVLALLVAVTGSLLPGILFHWAFNVVGSITFSDLPSQVMILWASLLVCAVYAYHLVLVNRRRNLGLEASDLSRRHPLAGFPRS